MDYISREDAIETIHRYFNALLNLLPTQTNGGYEVYLNTERVNTLLSENKALCELIKGLPTADVVERKKGKWLPVPGHNNILYCSNCTNEVIGRNEPRNFCPNCGADMKE